MGDEKVIEAIRKQIPELGGHMAEAANYIATHTDELAIYSMRELAKRAQVPPVTLVRLAQRLGLPGYKELRQQCVEAVLLSRSAAVHATRRNVDTARSILESTKGRSGLLEFSKVFFEAEHDVLRRAEAGLSEERLVGAVKLLAKAPNVFVAARRTSYPPAFTFAYTLRKARPSVRLLEDTSGGAEGPLEDVGPGDAFVAFTFAPFSKLTDMLVRRAVEAGASLIVISDSMAVPLRDLAGELFFLAPSTSHAFPESALGASAIANLLVALCVARLGDAAHKRIRRNEEFVVGSGEYMLARRSRRRGGSKDDD